MADYDKALSFFSRSLKLYKTLQDKIGIASCELNMANVYADKGDKPLAMEYYYKAIDIYEELGNKEQVAGLLSNIGLLYADDGDTEKALELYLKALKIQEEAGAKRGLGMLLDNIGLAYCEKEDYAKAIYYHQRALKANRESNDLYYEGIALGNIGNTYMKQGDILLGIRYIQAAVKLNEETENSHSLAMNLQYLGKAYIELAKNGENVKGQAVVKDTNTAAGEPIPADRTAKLTKAIDFLERGIALSREAEIPDGMQNCYSNISDAYRLLGNYKKSLEYSDSFNLMRDSLYSSDNRVKMAKLATKGEEALKKKQIAINQLITEKKKDERIYFSIGIGLSLLIVFGLFFSRKTLQKQKNISEKLLLNILPAEVAVELKKKGESDAKLFDDVTVLFTDFVGFTTVSEKLTPQQLVDELHACFTAFDGIMVKYGIEKIKTVGDAYLAVSGLPSADEKHAENAVKAAIDIRDFMSKRREALGESTFAIRIGINSGNVVAGIVGVKKFAYDIWGDTVNTAARMEQNSIAGKINVSETTYLLVKDKFKFDFRGEIEAKNKGVLKMYFVE